MGAKNYQLKYTVPKVAQHYQLRCAVPKAAQTISFGAHSIDNVFMTPVAGNLSTFPERC